MIKRIVSVVALSCSLWAVAPGVGAHDHRPPRVVLRSAGERQRGGPWSVTWTSGDEDGCVILNGDGVPNYTRPAMRWSPKRKVHLRLFKRHKPRRLGIRMYVRLDEGGNVTGKGRPADYNLRRVLINGKRVWIAGFFGRRTGRHLYVAVHVRYRDVEGCGGPQTMWLAYHLKRRSTSKANPIARTERLSEVLDGEDVWDRRALLCVGRPEDYRLPPLCAAH